jgi:adenosylhomocysteine nucleosidase
MGFREIGLIAAMAPEFEPLRRSLRPDQWRSEPLLQTEALILTLDSGVTVYAAACGVGKVNAAHVATLLALRYAVDVVINFGVAGGFQADHQILDFLVATSFTYTDVDICNLDLAPGQLLDEPVAFPSCPALVDVIGRFAASLPRKVHYGKFGASDAFVRRERPDIVRHIRTAFPDVICVDMESTAIAHVCSKFGVPAFAVKVVTDVPIWDSEDATKPFLDTLTEASALVVAFVVKLVEAVAAQ